MLINTTDISTSGGKIEINGLWCSLLGPDKKYFSILEYNFIKVKNNREFLIN